MGQHQKPSGGRAAISAISQKPTNAALLHAPQRGTLTHVQTLASTKSRVARSFKCPYCDHGAVKRRGKHYLKALSQWRWPLACKNCSKEWDWLDRKTIFDRFPFTRDANRATTRASPTRKVAIDDEETTQTSRSKGVTRDDRITIRTSPRDIVTLLRLLYWNDGVVTRVVSELHIDADVRFSLDDLLDVTSLIRKLRTPTREVDKWLRSQVSRATSATFMKCEGQRSVPPSLRNALVGDLNRMLCGPSIHNTKRFGGILLRSRTRRLLSSSPRHNEARELNRLLIEDAYPAEISRKRFSGVSYSDGTRMPLFDDETVTDVMDWCIHWVKNPLFRRFLRRLGELSVDEDRDAILWWDLLSERRCLKDLVSAAAKMCSACSLAVRTLGSHSATQSPILSQVTYMKHAIDLATRPPHPAKLKRLPGGGYYTTPTPIRGSGA